MLWWIIGVWLASGAVIPVLWLLSMASRGVFARDLGVEQRQVTVGSDDAATPASAPRSAYGIRRLASSLAMRAFRLPGHSPDGMRVTPNRSHVGQYVLSGLITLGALMRLFVSSISDLSVTIRDLRYGTLAVAHATLTPAQWQLIKAEPVAGVSCSFARRSAPPTPDARDRTPTAAYGPWVAVSAAAQLQSRPGNAETL